jgi:hypothetical protein
MTAALLLQFGPYTTSPYLNGDVVIDEAAGEVRIIGLSAAPIPWPTCRPRPGRAVPVLCGALSADRTRRAPERRS